LSWVMEIFLGWYTVNRGEVQMIWANINARLLSIARRCPEEMMGVSKCSRN
jgi:hypothetical protein